MVAFVALCAWLSVGCSRVQRHTVDQVATTTAKVEASATTSSIATAKQEVHETRIARGGRTITPLPGGGWDMSWYYEIGSEYASAAKAEDHHDATVKREAEGKTTLHTDEKQKSGRPWWHWPVLVVVVCAIAWMVFKAWRLKRRLTP